jgi:hypothetical protein
MPPANKVNPAIRVPDFMRQPGTPYRVAGRRLPGRHHAASAGGPARPGTARSVTNWITPLIHD